MNLEEYRKKYEGEYEIVYNEIYKSWDVYFAEPGERLGLMIEGCESELDAFESIESFWETSRAYAEKHPPIQVEPRTEAELIEAQKSPNWREPY